MTQPTNPILSSHTQLFDDINFTVRFDIYENKVYFEAIEIEVRDLRNELPTPLYKSATSGLLTASAASASIFAKGYVWRSGASEWAFQEQNGVQGMLLRKGREALACMGDLPTATHDFATKLMDEHKSEV